MLGKVGLGSEACYETCKIRVCLLEAAKTSSRLAHFPLEKFSVLSRNTELKFQPLPHFLIDCCTDSSLRSNRALKCCAAPQILPSWSYLCAGAACQDVCQDQRTAAFQPHFVFAFPWVNPFLFFSLCYSCSRKPFSLAGGQGFSEEISLRVTETVTWSPEFQMNEVNAWTVGLLTFSVHQTHGFGLEKSFLLLLLLLLSHLVSLFPLWISLWPKLSFLEHF